jgi:hypothetical protein
MSNEKAQRPPIRSHLTVLIGMRKSGCKGNSRFGG